MRLIPRRPTNEFPAAFGTGRGDPDAMDAVRAASGDIAAFERIYHRHGAKIFALATRFLGRDLAEDALQDAFIHAWEGLAQFRGDSLFATWLHRIAVNVFLRQATTARRIERRFAATDIATLAGTEASLETKMDVEAALRRLSEELRIVVVLHDLEGFGHREIADTLGISPSASKMRLHRARMQLREWLVP